LQLGAIGIAPLTSAYLRFNQDKAAPLRSAAARRRAGLCLGGPPGARRATLARIPKSVANPPSPLVRRCRHASAPIVQLDQ